MIQTLETTGRHIGRMEAAKKKNTSGSASEELIKNLPTNSPLRKLLEHNVEDAQKPKKKKEIPGVKPGKGPSKSSTTGETKAPGGKISPHHPH